MPCRRPIASRRARMPAGVKSLAVDRHRVSGLEVDGDGHRLIRGVERVADAAQQARGRRDGGILQRFSLIRGVEQIHIDRVRTVAGAEVHLDAVLGCVGEKVAARRERPFAPRREDAHVGAQGAVGVLEAHLVVALSGGAVRDGVGTRLLRDPQLRGGDEGPADRGAHEVLALVERVGAVHRERIVTSELLTQVEHADVDCAETLGLELRGLELLTLSEIGDEGRHRAAVRALEPDEDHGGVEPARVGEDDVLGCLPGGRGHDVTLPRRPTRPRGCPSSHVTSPCGDPESTRTPC